jgi:hypothetical protein
LFEMRMTAPEIVPGSMVSSTVGVGAAAVGVRVAVGVGDGVEVREVVAEGWEESVDVG